MAPQDPPLDPPLWFHIDMRDPSHLWNSVDGVYKSLYRCFAPRIATISKMIESMIPLKSVTFSIPGVQLKEKPVTVKDVQDLLTYAGNDLSAASKSGLKPVLFIDEANYMYRYLDDKEAGQEV